GNMKLMINGAITIGTLDGANVEILEQVGKENMFLFGLTTPEVENLWRSGYDPMVFINQNPDLKAVIEMLSSEVLGSRFDEIANALTTSTYGVADAYMVMADFDAYVKTQERVEKTYLDRAKFNNMSLINIAKAGLFSADRAVKEYGEDIWNINSVK
ncbi:MAG: glycogen/starch/alpha-glucan phosphorylase, partial [Oscillospiraceae bacterium]